jgi:hypothetical protein
MQNKTFRMLSGICSAAALLWLTGCQSTPKDGRSAGTMMDDKDITENVRHAFNNEPAYKFTDVSITTYAGVVELTGFTIVQDQKNRAQQLTANVYGVRQVVNGIIVRPPMQPTGPVNSQAISSNLPDQNAAPPQNTAQALNTQSK